MKPLPPVTGTLHLLGSFRLYADHADLILDQARLPALIAYLALHPGQPMARQHISFLLWPDSDEAQARTNLRNLLFKLKKAWATSSQIIEITRATLCWRGAQGLEVDVLAFEAALAQAHQTTSPTQAETALRAALAHYGGDLLPDCYDDWATVARERLRTRYLQALAQLAQLLEEKRLYDEAIEQTQILLAVDPLQEDAYRRLMQLYAAKHDRAAALRAYHTCASLLARELGVEPSEETQNLHHRLLNTAQRVIPVQTSTEETPLVGRHAEWDTLYGAWQQSRQGKAQLVLIWGEAGIGKTRLASELLDKATHQGISTASSRAYALGGALAYTPVTEWLRQPALKSALGKIEPLWQAEVARLLPEWLSEHPNLPNPGPLREGWQRQRFYQGSAQLLQAAPAPLLLHVDDLQWCDGETLAFLQYALAALAALPMLVVGTVRSEEIGEQHPLHSLRHALHHTNQLIEIELGPLNVAESAELATQTAGALLDAKVQAVLYAQSEGHPLFLVEMVRIRQAGSQAHSQAEDAPHPTETAAITTIPPKIRRVISARLDQLSATARTLAQLAAVMGRAFTYAVLHRAGDGDEDALVQALDELWRRRIVREQGTEGYDFSHDRIREVAYAEMSNVRRRLFHRRVAAALTDLYAHDLEPIHGQLALHHDRSGNLAEACLHYRLAGERAVEQYADADAQAYFSRALALTPATESESKFKLYLAREHVFNQMGARDRQQEDLRALDALCPKVLPLRPEASAEVALRWAEHGNQTANHALTIEKSTHAITLAHSLPNSTQLQAQAHHWLATGFWWHTQFAEARHHFQRAAELARSVGMSSVEARAIEHLAATGMFTGMTVEHIQSLLDHALILVEPSGNPERIASLYNKLGYLPYARGAAEDYATAQDYYEKGIAIVRQIGKRMDEASLLINLAMIHTLCGRYQRAGEILREGLQLSQQTKYGSRIAIAYHFEGVRLLEQGDLDGSLTMLQKAVREIKGQGTHHYGLKALADLGLLYHLRGDQPMALAVLQETLTAAQQQEDKRGLAALWTRLGYVYEAQQNWETALAAYQTAVQIHGQMGQVNYSMNAIAGQARLALRQADLAAAYYHADAIWSRLQAHTLEATVESARVYATGYAVFEATGDFRAHEIAAKHCQILQARAEHVDAERVALFWQLPDHQFAASVALSLFQQKRHLNPM